MLAAKVLAGLNTGRSTNICGPTIRLQLRLASSVAVIALFSFWMALGTAAFEAVTAGDAEASGARNKFLQSLFAELSKKPDTHYDAFRIVWRREHQSGQACPEAGSVHCFDRPLAGKASEGQQQRSSYRAVLVVAAEGQQMQSKAPCDDRSWTAKACIGTRCFNQTLPSFNICRDGGDTALIDVSELMASDAASTAEQEQGEDGLCVSLMWESNAQASAVDATSEVRSEATLLVYNRDKPVKGLHPVLAATRAAILEAVTTCGQRTSAERTLRQSASGDCSDRQQQCHRQVTSPQPTASDEQLSQLPIARNHKRRHARHTPYTGPLGPCSLRAWTISYDDVPNDLFEKPYFPRVQNVNYCVGSCQSLLPHASLNFTRHAFMRTRQFGDAVTGILVPKPCCVPVAFWPTSMAYLERNGMMRIELREDLSVRACGCR